MAGELDRYGVETKIRILIQEVTEPIMRAYACVLTERCAECKESVARLHGSFDREVRKIEEANIFLNKLSQSRISLDQIRSQLYELVFLADVA